MLGSVNAAAGQLVTEYRMDDFNRRYRNSPKPERVIVQMLVLADEPGVPPRNETFSLLADLRRMGLRGLRDSGNDLDPSSDSYVYAKCYVTQYESGGIISYAYLAGIDYWDHELRAEIDTFEALQVGAGNLSRFQGNVEHCGEALSNPLIEMGYGR